MAEGQSWWCRQDVDGTVHFDVVLRLRFSDPVYYYLRIWVSIVYAWENFLVAKQGPSSVVKLLGGRGAIVVVSTKWLLALCILLLFVIAFGLIVWVRARSSKLHGDRGAIMIVLSRRW